MINNVDWNLFKGTKRGEKGFIRLWEQLEQNGHVLLTEYTHSKSKVLIDFKCGHNPHELRPNDYKNGQGCPKCYNERRNDTKKRNGEESFTKLIQQNGHVLLTEYINNKTKVLVDFKCGHAPHWTRPDKYKWGDGGCPECAGNTKEQGKQTLLKLLEQNGHILLSEYKTAHTKVLIDFKCGHNPHWIKPCSYKNNHGCPICKESRGEKVIKEHLKASGFNVESQLKLNNKFYDIYIPALNLIIEVHGQQHYEDVKIFKSTAEEEQENDRIKQAYAEAMGYNYMVVDYREHSPELALKRFIKQFKQYQQR